MNLTQVTATKTVLVKQVRGSGRCTMASFGATWQVAENITCHQQCLQENAPWAISSMLCSRIRGILLWKMFLAHASYIWFLWYRALIYSNVFVEPIFFHRNMDFFYILLPSCSDFMEAQHFVDTWALSDISASFPGRAPGRHAHSLELEGCLSAQFVCGDEFGSSSTSRSSTGQPVRNWGKRLCWSWLDAHAGGNPRQETWRPHWEHIYGIPNDWELTGCVPERHSCRRDKRCAFQPLAIWPGAPFRVANWGTLQLLPKTERQQPIVGESLLAGSRQSFLAKWKALESGERPQGDWWEAFDQCRVARSFDYTDTIFMHFVVLGRMNSFCRAIRFLDLFSCWKKGFVWHFFSVVVVGAYPDLCSSSGSR